MKKILFLCFCVIFITGCQVNYDINLNSDGYSENLVISESDLSKFSSYNIGEDFEYYDKMPLSIFTDYAELSYNELNNLDKSLLYEKNNILNDDGIIFSISGRTDNKLLFEKSNLINMFGTINSIHENDKVEVSYSLKPEAFNNYSMVDNITINIRDNDNSILSNNADNRNGDIYTWIISRDDFNKKTINFVLSYKENTVKKNVKKYKKKLDDPLERFSIFLIVITIIFLIVYKFVIIRFNSCNKL